MGPYGASAVWTAAGCCFDKPVGGDAAASGSAAVQCWWVCCASRTTMHGGSGGVSGSMMGRERWAMNTFRAARCPGGVFM